ncbi:hypothetical protein N656DRAFT_576198 [Canariomyces notabilis]|uniref:Uncharacterized protein n=1 Tax=Canariomyces notabilis TaxID=2074819 RepID=A0AAN6TGT3_9PEZI|nr:hypothetical protein N656DRAFT_576198 [Canariomyces arenarius]
MHRRHEGPRQTSSLNQQMPFLPHPQQISERHLEHHTTASRDCFPFIAANRLASLISIVANALHLYQKTILFGLTTCKDHWFDSSIRQSSAFASLHRCCDLLTYTKMTFLRPVSELSCGCICHACGDSSDIVVVESTNCLQYSRGISMLINMARPKDQTKKTRPVYRLEFCYLPYPLAAPDGDSPSPFHRRMYVHTLSV